MEYLAFSLVTTTVPAMESLQFKGNEYLIVGAASGINGLLSVFGTPTIGRLSDAIGRKWLMLFTLLVTSLPTCMLIATTDMYVYESLRAVTGIAAATFSLAFAVVADVTPPAQRGAGIGRVVATLGAAISVGPLIATGLLEAFGPLGPNVSILALTAANACYVIFVLPETLPPRSEPAQVCKHLRSPLETLLPLFQHPALRLVGAVVFFVNVAEQGLISLLISYLQRHLGFGPLEISVFALVLGTLMAVSQSVLLPVLLRRFSARAVIIGACLANVAHTTLYGFATQPWQVFCILVLAAGAFLGFPAVADVVSRMTPRERQGQYQGAVTGVRALTIGIGPSLFGAVLTATCPAAAAAVRGFDPRCAVTFLVAAALVLVAAVLALWLPREEDLGLIKEEIRALSRSAEHRAGSDATDDSETLAASSVTGGEAGAWHKAAGTALLVDSAALSDL